MPTYRDDHEANDGDTVELLDSAWPDEFPTGHHCIVKGILDTVVLVAKRWDDPSRKWMDAKRFRLVRRRQYDKPTRGEPNADH